MNEYTRRSWCWTHFNRATEVNSQGNLTVVGYCLYCNSRYKSDAQRMMRHLTKCTKVPLKTKLEFRKLVGKRKLEVSSVTMESISDDNPLKSTRDAINEFLNASTGELENSGDNTDVTDYQDLVNVLTTPAKRERGQQRSWVWNFYNRKVEVTAQGNDVVAGYCQFCNTRYKTNPQRMIRHLDNCANVPDDTRIEIERMKAEALEVSTAEGFPMQAIERLIQNNTNKLDLESLVNVDDEDGQNGIESEENELELDEVKVPRNGLNAAASSSEAEQGRSQKLAQRSWVWNFYHRKAEVTANGNDVVAGYCHFCNTRYKTNFPRMIRHLENCASFPENLRTGMEKMKTDALFFSTLKLEAIERYVNTNTSDIDSVVHVDDGETESEENDQDDGQQTDMDILGNEKVDGLQNGKEGDEDEGDQDEMQFYSIPTSTKRKPLSWCWDYYDRAMVTSVNGNPVVVGYCKFCATKYKSDPQRMMRHLRNCQHVTPEARAEINQLMLKTPPTVPVKEGPPLKIAKQSSLVDELSNSSRLALTRFPRPLSNESQVQADLLLANAFESGNIPSSFLENSFLRQFVHLLNPSYRLPYGF